MSHCWTKVDRALRRAMLNVAPKAH